MAKVEKKEVKIFMLPPGRLINSSLFEKDQFDERSTPSYKVEIAFPKTPDVLGPFFEALLGHADATWQDTDKDGKPVENVLNIDGGDIISGVLDGDKQAKKREAKGKAGDAYADHWVIRANTIYNKDGADGPGGIAVYDENVDLVTIVNASVIYNGCMVQAGVTIDDYEDDRSGNHAMKSYLTAVQKVGDGERLVSARDNSSLFKPVGKPAGAADATTGRRKRG